MELETPPLPCRMHSACSVTWGESRQLGLPGLGLIACHIPSVIRIPKEIDWQVIDSPTKYTMHRMCQ